MQNPKQVISSLKEYLVAIENRTLSPGTTVDLIDHQLGSQVGEIVKTWNDGTCPNEITFKLTKNNITQEVFDIADSIANGRCPAGTRIELDYNPLTAEGCRALLQAVRNQRCPIGVFVDVGNGTSEGCFYEDVILKEFSKPGSWASGLRLTAISYARLRNNGGVLWYLPIHWDFRDIFNRLAQGLCPPILVMDLRDSALSRNYPGIIANALRSPLCPTHLHLALDGRSGWRVEDYKQIESAIRESPHLYGFEISFSNNYGIRNQDFLYTGQLVEAAREKRAAHAGLVALTFLQGLTQKDSAVYCLRSNFNMIEMILKNMCSANMAKNRQAKGYATRFANNVLTWHNDRQSGKTIESKMPRILGHKKRATALRVALSKLNLTQDRLTLIENQLGRYEPTKSLPELPSVLKDRLGHETFQELDRDFKRGPIKGVGGYYALLLALKKSIQDDRVGPTESVVKRGCW